MGQLRKLFREGLEFKKESQIIYETPIYEFKSIFHKEVAFRRALTRAFILAIPFLFPIGIPLLLLNQFLFKFNLGIAFIIAYLASYIVATKVSYNGFKDFAKQERYKIFSDKIELYYKSTAFNDGVIIIHYSEMECATLYNPIFASNYGLSDVKVYLKRYHMRKNNYIVYTMTNVENAEEAVNYMMNKISTSIVT